VKKLLAIALVAAVLVPLSIGCNTSSKTTSSKTPPAGGGGGDKDKGGSK